MLEERLQEETQGAHNTHNHKDPQEHPIYHHGNVLPVLNYLEIRGKGNIEIRSVAHNTDNAMCFIINSYCMQPVSFTHTADTLIHLTDIDHEVLLIIYA